MTICSLIAFVYILMVEIEINIQIMYDRLFNLVRREEVILFVGAGFSIKAGYPSGKELCQIIYNNLSESEKSKISKELSLPELTEEFVQLRGSSRNAIITLLKNIYVSNEKSHVR